MSAVSSDRPATLNDIINALSKRTSSRSEKDMTYLLEFFKDNNFFKDFERQNGIEALKDCYRSLKYEVIKKGNFVMKQGDYGDTYYIVIKGKAAVLLNMDITKKWTIASPEKVSEEEYNKYIKEFLGTPYLVSQNVT